MQQIIINVTPELSSQINHWSSLGKETPEQLTLRLLKEYVYDCENAEIISDEVASGKMETYPYLRAYKMHNRFTAVIHKEEDLFVAECPEVGTASQGYTPSEAITNLKEATELYLEETKKIMTDNTPFMTTFEVAANA